MPPLHDPDVWLFDLDNTLYPARCNLFAQIDVRIGRYISDWRCPAARSSSPRATCRMPSG
jgi:FMN phosphatase YigB (HAD superfamily)